MRVVTVHVTKGMTNESEAWGGAFKKEQASDILHFFCALMILNLVALYKLVENVLLYA
jgi:hypothetical protein